MANKRGRPPKKKPIEKPIEEPVEKPIEEPIQDEANEEIVESMEEQVTDTCSQKECFLAMLGRLRPEEMTEANFRRKLTFVKRASRWAAEEYNRG